MVVEVLIKANKSGIASISIASESSMASIASESSIIKRSTKTSVLSAQSQAHRKVVKALKDQANQA
jgi:hypothetical protein